jgi:iron(III) transport system permease protein
MGAVYWPMVQLVADAFGHNDPFFKPSSANSFFLSDIQYELLQHSLTLATGATVLALMIGLPFAFFIQRSSMWGRGIFSLAYLIPLLIPPYMQAIVWDQMLATNGYVSRCFTTIFNLDNVPLDLHSISAAVVILAFSYFPFITLLTVSGLKNLDTGYEEAASLHGNRFNVLCRVTLPMIAPQILAGAIFVFIFSIIDFGVSDILRVKVYPVEIFIEYSAMYNERSAVLLATPLLVITSILIALELWLMKGKSFVNFYQNATSFPLVKSSKANGWAVAYCSLVILMTVIMPIMGLLDMAETFKNVPNAWNASADTLVFSLLMAILGAAVMTILAFFLAFSLTQASGALKLTLDYLTQLPFAFPPILLGIGLTKVWNQPFTDWLYSGSVMIVLGYLSHLIPFVIRIIYSGLQQIPPVLHEAGQLNGNRWWRVLIVITLPLIKNSLLAGFAVGFAFSLADLGTSLLIMPPGSETMPILIYNYLHYGASASVAIFCLMLLFIQSIIWMTLAAFNKQINTMETQ